MSEVFSELSAYDLDGTTRPGSLMGDAITFCVAEGLMDPVFANPGNPDMTDVRQFVALIPGISIAQFKSLTNRITDEAKEKSYPWALERIEYQISRGGHVIIASHAMVHLVRAYAKGLNLHRGRGSHFPTSKGKFSGRPKRLDKKQAILRYMREKRIRKLDFAAGDTELDLPMLEMAEHAVVVNPVGYLAELAIARSWEIIKAEASRVA